MKIIGRDGEVWFGLVWSCVYAQLSFPNIIDSRWPWYCTVIDFSESNGLKTYDIMKVPGTSKYILPFYENNQFGFSGVYVYDIGTGNVSTYYPTVVGSDLKRVRISSSVMHNATQWYGAGFSRFDSLGTKMYRLTIEYVDLIKSTGYYIFFNSPVFFRDSLAVFYSGTSISQRNILFGGFYAGTSLNHLGLTVSFDPISQSIIGKMWRVPNGEIVINNVHPIDSAYLLISAIGKYNNDSYWKVVNLIIDTGISTIIDTFSFVLENYPEVEILSVKATWKNYCERKVLFTGYACEGAVQFQCGTAGYRCYGILGSYGIEKVPDNSLPQGYRWQFTKIDWIKKFWVPNLGGVKHMGFLYDLNVINTYRKQEITLVGWVNYKCNLSSRRWRAG